MSALPSTDRPEAPLRVLKHGGAFAVFDQHGDIIPEAGQQGLYHHDTRFLSGFERASFREVAA